MNGNSVSLLSIYEHNSTFFYFALSLSKNNKNKGAPGILLHFVYKLLHLMSFATMVDVNINKSGALDVLGIKIPCDVRCYQHIFQESKEAFNILDFLS